MRLLVLGLVACHFLQLSDGRPADGDLISRSSGSLKSLESFIATESPIALQGVLNNIGSSGYKAPGALPGMVVASPSTENPDYYYSWTRDSALTFQLLVQMFIDGNSSLQPLIEDYIIAQATVQTLVSPSGGLSSGGLAEPKFYVNMTSFMGPWGRPQRDGPALRAIAMITYSRWLLANGYNSTVVNVVWPIIQNDLTYVEGNWNQTGFDLWEETDGSSFFATIVQHKALVQGASLATEIGTACPGCLTQAPQILCFLQSYWDNTFILANINEPTFNGRSDIDSNTLLGSIHTFDPAAGCDDTTFQPCSSRALANHKVYVDTFRSIYEINSGKAEGAAVAVGRYPEDVFQGGNPWYLCTAAAAELLYDALYQWKALGELSVDNTSLPFFRDLHPSVVVGTYGASTRTFAALTSAVENYADGFMRIIQLYVPISGGGLSGPGGLSEQFSRDNGTQLSARDLTWSYASFLSAIARRSGTVPVSWGEQEANKVPSECFAMSAGGPYATPTATAFPVAQTETASTAIPTSPACAVATAVAVTFNLQDATSYGEEVYLSGSVDELGGWNINNMTALSSAAFSSSNPLWSVSVTFAAGYIFEYKYAKRESDDSLVWEDGPNRVYIVPTSCSSTVSEYDNW